MSEPTHTEQSVRSLRLRRERGGSCPRYVTRDGRFTIERYEDSPWRVIGQDDQASHALAVSDANRSFDRLADAREWLSRSTYDWIDNHADEIDAEYARMMRGSFND